MIFNYIKLKNFRQYKGEHFYEFSNPKKGEKKMTLIIAKNGVGKTTFLQAFRYCFYGQNANYLKLPKSDELLNNSLEVELKQMDETELSVEVSFTHKSIDYIARRTQKYYKKNTKMIKNGNGEFVLLYSTNMKGFKSLDQSSSEMKMWQILPPGLSHIFMFDGERIEKRIESNDYRKDLKESILGILDLKKIDYLIKLIGTLNRSRSVLGSLNSSISISTKEENDLKKIHSTLSKQLEDERDKLKQIVVEIKEKKKEIEKYRDIQKEIEQYKNDINNLERLESEVTSYNKDLDNFGEKYLMLSGKAILSKLLLSQKNNYEKFIQKSDNNKRFFQQVHIDTLKEIIKRQECLCGATVNENTDEFKRIEELFETALPLESAHHLNKIADTFKRVLSFQEQLEELKNIREQISKTKLKRRETENSANLLKEKIKRKEDELGNNSQVNIELLQEEENQLYVQQGETEKEIETTERLFKKKDNEYRTVLLKSVKNRKIREAIEGLEEIKLVLQEEQKRKDQHARSVLSEVYNRNFSKVIVGDYKIEIDNDYNLNITDLTSSKNVTEVMSTGQSVIVTMSFIKSLIETATIISRQVEENESYGVIMDAALSNVDETHINNLCQNNLNSLNQVIFLSFKRQLRNEMYEGIKDNIGKAYYLDREDNSIISEELDLTRLKEFIHKVEDKNE